jgi:hypothetical protein
MAAPHQRLSREINRLVGQSDCAGQPDGQLLDRFARHRDESAFEALYQAATGEGFQRGNQHVLEELGRNVGIIWGGRTSLQAGGERAGRAIWFTVEDARRLARESSMIAVVSPEISRPWAFMANRAFNPSGVLAPRGSQRTFTFCVDTRPRAVSRTVYSPGGTYAAFGGP